MAKNSIVKLIEKVTYKGFIILNGLSRNHVMYNKNKIVTDEKFIVTFRISKELF